MKSHYPNCQLGDQCNCADQDEPEQDETPTSKVVSIIRKYNRWRRGDESIYQPSPHQIGNALDDVCELVESMERERDAAIKARIDSAREWSDQVANADARVARMKRELREANARAVDLERMVESLRGQLTKVLESVAKDHS